MDHLVALADEVEFAKDYGAEALELLGRLEPLEVVKMPSDEKAWDSGYDHPVEVVRRKLRMKFRMDWGDDDLDCDTLRKLLGRFDRLQKLTLCGYYHDNGEGRSGGWPGGKHHLYQSQVELPDLTHLRILELSHHHTKTFINDLFHHTPNLSALYLHRKLYHIETLPHQPLVPLEISHLRFLRHLSLKWNQTNSGDLFEILIPLSSTLSSLILDLRENKTILDLYRLSSFPISRCLLSRKTMELFSILNLS